MNKKSETYEHEHSSKNSHQASPFDMKYSRKRNINSSPCEREFYGNLFLLPHDMANGFSEQFVCYSYRRINCFARNAASFTVMVESKKLLLPSFDVSQEEDFRENRFQFCAPLFSFCSATVVTCNM